MRTFLRRLGGALRRAVVGWWRNPNGPGVDAVERAKADMLTNNAEARNAIHGAQRNVDSFG